MHLYNKIRAVNKVFKKLDRHIESFQLQSGLSCVPNCGLCCFNPDLYATPLEFLPVAYYLNKQGLAEELYDKININQEEKICVFAKKLKTDEDKGFCSGYENRGLICRLFGFSAMKNKTGTPELITCKLIKQKSDFILGDHKPSIVPYARDYFFQLKYIDPVLGGMQLRINRAILEALNIILLYDSYRKRPRRSA